MDLVKVWKDKSSYFGRNELLQLILCPVFTLEASHLLGPTKSVLQCGLVIFKQALNFLDFGTLYIQILTLKADMRKQPLTIAYTYTNIAEWTFLPKFFGGLMHPTITLVKPYENNDTI